MLKAVVFDAYGTLISTGNGSVKAAEQILMLNRRQDIPAADFYARWKSHHKSHMDALTHFLPESELFRMDLERLYAEYSMERDASTDVRIMLDTLGKRTAFPETQEVLQALSADVTVCIGSTTDTAPLLQDLERNRLSVERIFTSELLRVYKPQPAFYHAILQKLGLNSSEVLFVGDSLIDDVLGPQRMGMKTCWVSRSGADSADVKPDFTVTDLRGLYDIIMNI